MCRTCGEEKPITEFRSNGVRNGVPRRKYHCNDCLRARDRERYTRQKSTIADIKATGCAKCGETRVEALDLHHIDPAEKDFTIGSSPLRSAQQLHEEAEKCIVLCANCHRIYHYRLLHEGLTIDAFLNE